MPAVQKATSLAVPADHPAARRIAGQAHSDLLVLRRFINEKTGKLFTDIRVDDIRRTVPFFGSTAGEGGWRVAIVDPLDELNKNGENALLKVLEEPPPRALLFLISHAPGRVLPTIRSRCRTLILRPLAAEDVARALAAAGEGAAADDIRAAAAAADGSVGRALMFLEGDALELRQQVVEQLERLPALDPRALHALGDEIAGTQAEPLAAFMDAVNAWLGGRLRDGPQEGAAARPRRRGLDRGQPRGARGRGLQSRPQAAGVFGVRATGRGRSPLTPSGDKTAAHSGQARLLFRPPLAMCLNARAIRIFGPQRTASLREGSHEPSYQPPQIRRRRRRSVRRERISDAGDRAERAAEDRPADGEDRPARRRRHHAEEGITAFLKDKNFTLAGRKIDLIVADTGGNPAGAKNKAQELVERDKVNVVLGPFAAFELLATVDYLAQAQDADARLCRRRGRHAAQGQCRI